MRRWILLVFFLCATLTFSAQAQDEFKSPYALQEIAEGIKTPTGIAQPPGDSTRLFVTDLHGIIYVIENGVLLDTPFLDVSKDLITAGFGQGLHNITFHPQYQQNGYFYIAYTQPDRSAALVRYQVSADNPDLADPTSAKIILVIQHATEFHYGGGLAFGPDGDLYWSMGDGAYKASPAQSVKSDLGKIVRLDVDHGDPYSIPPDNPFLGVDQARPELWAIGLRNPWRFSFDQQTGDLYIADVGEAQNEEIDFQPAGTPGGQNYGWSRYEGDALFKGGDKDGLTFPVVEYAHDSGNCSITGGYVYRGSALPDLVGKYLFADYCSGWIWSTYQKTPGSWYTAQLLKTDLLITTFGQDQAGELYVGDSKTGAIYKLVKASS